MKNNSLFIVKPFFNGLWVFNDAKVGLTEEPFVAGADDFIEYVISKKGYSFKKAEHGFNLVFSHKEFPGYDYQLDKINGEKDEGTWYAPVNAPDFLNFNGENKLWLCPALELYYSIPPEKLFMRFTL